MKRLLTDEGIQEFSDFFGVDFLEKYIPKKLKQTNKWLLLADLHLPFHNVKLFQQTIEENKDCDGLIIAGDIFDMFDMSPYRKTTYKPFKEEFREAFVELKFLCRHFPEVKIMLTNHDKRPYKRLYDSVLPQLLPFLHKNILEELISLIPNVEIISQKALGRDVGYIAQQGNIVFTHIEKSNIDVTKTVQEIHKTIKIKWQEALNIKPYDILVQAHNHSAGQVWLNDTLLVQIPCLIDISEPAFDYIFDGKAKGNPPALGYATVMKPNGKFDPNTFKIHKFRQYK